MKKNFLTEEEPPIRLRYYFFGSVALWSIFIGLSLAWNLKTQKSGILEAARIEARAGFDKDVVYRRWNAASGGVYAPVTEVTQPNPYLDVRERDITTSLGKELTKINPAYMTRQVHELGLKTHGVRGHITSLNPIRPANAPDPWEALALKSFQTGLKEVSSVEEIEGNDYMRLMRPLLTEKSCLKCHAVQGYKLGDIRGGISVSTPMAPLMAIAQSNIIGLWVGHGLLWLAGLVGISLGFRRLNQQIHKHIGLDESLQESEEKYRQIIEGATDVIYTVDSQGHCTYVNVPGQKLTGYTVGELVGKHFTELIPVDWRERVQLLYIKQFQDREKETRMEFPIITKAGEEKWVDQIVTVLTEGDRITGFQSIVRDITDRSLAEKALKESEEKYRSILESIEEGYFEVDLSGNLTFFNDELCKIFGYSKDELTGMSNRQYTDEENAKELYQTFNKVYTTGKPDKGFGWEIIRKDGTKIIVEASISLRSDAGGEPIGFRGVVRDISEKQRLEIQLQQAQKMESIGTLAGGIAHNFNNLLMGIQGNTSMMLLNIDSGNPRHKNLKNIEKLVENGAKLTAQLIGYAREGSYEVKPTSLNQLVKETSGTFGMTKREITVHQELSERLYGIEADQSQIEQALLNLYVNAADAMPGGGDLFLKTMNVTDKNITGKLYKAKPGNYVLLTVRDTGIGMDKETRERIFEPFFTTKGLASGTGLGTASAYGTVKGHGGYIDVDSEKGKGTTFSIYLPATEKVIEEKEVLSDELVKGKGTVLLVDDEEMVLEAGEELLNHLGYEVLLVQNGREALELYKKNQDKIDLVLLDMVMPVMGGGEAFDRIKEINTNVKVLLSSGYSLEGEAKEILERGCDAFIQKPFKLEQLSQKLRAILDKK